MADSVAIGIGGGGGGDNTSPDVSGASSNPVGLKSGDVLAGVFDSGEVSMVSGLSTAIHESTEFTVPAPGSFNLFGTGSHFTFSSPENDFFIWFDLTVNTAPAIGGIGISVNVQTASTATDVAILLSNISHPDFTITNIGPVVTITNNSGGNTTDFADVDASLSSITITQGTSGFPGAVRLQEGDKPSTVGQIWTAKGINGEGEWKKPITGVIDHITYSAYASKNGSFRIKFANEDLNTGNGVILATNTDHTRYTALAKCSIVTTASAASNTGACMIRIFLYRANGIQAPIVPGASTTAASVSCSASTTYILEPGDYVVCYTTTAALATDSLNTFTIKAQAI